MIFKTSMKVLRSLSSDAARSPCALAIGNFDGVHKGHQALLHQLKTAAYRLGLPPTVLTFSPHPRQFFAQQSGMLSDVPITITPFRDKMQALADAGVEQVYAVRFDAAMASLTAQAFIEKVLVGALNVRWMTVGENFRFGKDRAGTTELLVEMGRLHRFEVVVMPAVMDGDIRISSSEVRQALTSCQFDRVASLLGRPYQLSGHVVQGNRLGREMGFPTANLSVKQDTSVLSGVFISRVHGLSGKPLPAVSVVGNRPTVIENGHTVLETHLLGFSGDIYGMLIKVEFLKKLRDNRKFPDLAALKKAIRQDINTAESYFSIREAAANGNRINSRC